MAVRFRGGKTLHVMHPPVAARRRACRAIALLLSLGIGLVTACSSSTGSDSPTAAPSPAVPPRPLSAGDDVLPAYVPPDPLPPGQPGDVVKSTPWRAVPGMRTWLVLYRSTAADG